MEDYETLRLQVGVPGRHDLIPEDSFIMQNNFEELHGVDFKKGCYVGQEIVARMKYKGTTRKSLFRVESDKDLPKPGEKITADGKLVGEMRSSMGNYGLALCDMSAVEAAGSNFTSGGVVAKLEPLAL